METIYGPFTPHYKPKPLKSGALASSRYLWTDAFAVCNFLTLFVESQQEQYLEQAKALIEQVHNILGKDRTLQNRLGKLFEQK